MNIPDAMDWLMAALPPADSLCIDQMVLRSFAAHALWLRTAVSYCAALPEPIFLSYVLCPRVNDERLIEHRSAFYAELAPRVAGKTAREAALEANFWCLEKATYQSTDERTAPPTTVLCRAIARCGEESTLLTCALRSIGIPARQIYAPRWAHCDDNHAWVEAYIDGDWHYMGACEPAPALDRGWFTAAASRAMLLHTRAFGAEPSGSEVLNRAGAMLILNRTDAYAPTRVLTVRVSENGRPVSRVFVRFELYNTGELYPLNTQETDEDGVARIRLGLGVLRVHCTDGRRYTTGVVDTRVESERTFDFSQARPAILGESRFDLISPKEQMTPPYPEDAAHQERVDQANARRASYEATFDTSSERLRAARGNHAVIRAFLLDPDFAESDKEAVLSTLREKDLADATTAMLRDALLSALPAKANDPENVWRESVLAPRVENEALLASRAELRAACAREGLCFSDAESVVAWVDGAIEPSETDIPTRPYIDEIIPCDAEATLRARRGDRRSRRLLAVSLCRALGFAARLNPWTGEVEYWRDGAYRGARRATARVVLCAPRPLRYGLHASLGRLERGVFETLRLGECPIDPTLTLDVAPGVYRLVCGARQIDGAVLCRTVCFRVEAGETARVECLPPEDRTAERLLRAELPDIPLDRVTGERTTLTRARAGQCAVLAFLAPAEEPTEHLLNELLFDAARVMQSGCALCFVLARAADVRDAKVARVLAEIPGSQAFVCPDPRAAQALRRALGVGDARLPLSVAMDQEGRGLYGFANYNVGVASMLLDILAASRSSSC